jgi:hypothetical protein
MNRNNFNFIQDKQGTPEKQARGKEQRNIWKSENNYMKLRNVEVFEY